MNANQALALLNAELADLPLTVLQRRHVEAALANLLAAMQAAAATPPEGP